MAVNPKEGHPHKLELLLKDAQERKDNAENAHILLNTAVMNLDDCTPYQAAQIAVLHVEIDNEVNYAYRTIGVFQDTTELEIYRRRNDLMNTVLLDEALGGKFENIRRFLSLYADELSMTAGTITNTETSERFKALSLRYSELSAIIPDNGPSVSFDEITFKNIEPTITAITDDAVEHD